MRRSSLGSIRPVASKPFTSPAICTGNSLASKRVIFPTPDWPSSIAAQVVGASRPTGVTAPTPVTTTRFIPMARG